MTGADISACDTKYGWTALHLAAVEGRSEVVEVLVEAGANPNEKVISTSRLYTDLSTHLIHLCLFCSQDAGRCTALQIAATPEVRLLMSRIAAELEMRKM